MSILLDALKKSETQRQLGKTPTIHTTLETPDTERGREQQWIALSLLAISAVAIAWFGWQQFREPAATLDVVGVLTIPQVEESPVVAENPESVGIDHKPPASLRNGKNDLAGLTILHANNPGEDIERREKLNQSFSSYEAEKDTAGATEADKPLPAVAQASSGPAANQSSAAVESKTVISSKRSPRPQPHEPEPISFWQLPQALRDDLPEFRINVLVYAQKPQDRFLLINGQRLVEKEEFTDGVILEEIRSDGAVFRYRKYRFLVKG